MKQTLIQQIARMCVIGILFVVALPIPSEAAEKIVLVSSEDTKDSFYGRWFDLIYTEVFRQLGYEFQYRGYPGGRAPVMAEKGYVDGEIHRAASYEKTAKNLLKVPESSFSVPYVAYAVKPGIVLNGWESLKNTNYIVEYRRGAKVPETVLPAVVKTEKLSDITKVEQGLKKLVMGRTDIYVDQEAVVTETLRKLDAVEFAPLYPAGIMSTTDSYVYLHKKHTELIPKIAEVLKAMKQEGLIDRYRKIALEEQ